MKHILFLLLFNILSFVSLQSQPSCVFTQYTTKDGLIQKTISYILQDRKGFIWVSTWDGINRFDGYTFKNYKARPGDLIGFNFMTVMNHYEEYVKEAIAAGADFIVSGAGLPVNLAKYAAGTRAEILPIVSSARALKLIVKQWQRADRLPDAVVVEGPLAGGHLGYPYGHLVDGTFDTLEDSLVDVVDYVRELEEKNGVIIPVIAGGGVRSHADVERLMVLGASGVQVGTKFVATEECDAAPAFKQAYLRSRKEDVQLIESPVGLAARAIRNSFLEKVEKQGRIPVQRCYQCMNHCKQAETKYCISQALIDAVQGREGLVFCGANAYEIEKLSTVEKVMQELCGE